MSNDITTTNFADFGWRERKMAAELLTASIDQGFPEDFCDDGVTIMMNRNSGNVFFTNSDYQVAMMNGDKLESFYVTPYHGHEGFKDELRGMYDADSKSWNKDDIEYLHEIDVISDEEYELCSEVE